MESYDRSHEVERQRPPEQAVAEPAEPEQAPAERLASNIGNQAFSVLARDGAGILPDGRAHPDVEKTIAQTRGGGAPLEPSTQERFSGTYGDDLGDVRVHTGPEAEGLARSVSARAFTTGSDVYFAQGEYSPGSGEGQQLIGHELAHVVQQRGAPTSGPLTVSQPGDQLEVEADQASRE